MASRVSRLPGLSSSSPWTQRSPPEIGLSPAPMAARLNLTRLHVLLWSVTATAGMPFSATALTNGLILTRPSTREYSVWTRRWTKEGLIDFLSSGAKKRIGDCNDGGSQGPVVMVPTVAQIGRASCRERAEIT